MRTLTFRPLAAAALLSAAACGSPSPEVTPQPTSIPAVVSLSIAGGQPTIEVGDSTSFYAIAIHSDGLARPVDGVVTWQTSDDMVAEVDAVGEVIGVGPGRVDVVASSGSLTTTRTVAVAPRTRAIEVRGVARDYTTDLPLAADADAV